jgi:hypothetical protein
MYDLIDEDGDTARCTLAEFLDANGSDDELCDAVAALDVGAEYVAGGGAAPMVRIRRVA